MFGEVVGGKEEPDYAYYTSLGDAFVLIKIFWVRLHVSLYRWCGLYECLLRDGHDCRGFCRCVVV